MQDKTIRAFPNALYFGPKNKIFRKLCGKRIHKRLDALREGGELSSWPGRSADRFPHPAILPVTALQRQQRADQTAVVTFQLFDARKGAGDAHLFGISGKDAGSHGPYQLFQRFGAQSPAHKVSKGFIGFIAGGRHEQFGGQPRLAPPRHKR